MKDIHTPLREIAQPLRALTGPVRDQLLKIIKAVVTGSDSQTVTQDGAQPTDITNNDALGLQIISVETISDTIESPAGRSSGIVQPQAIASSIQEVPQIHLELLQPSVSVSDISEPEAQGQEVIDGLPTDVDINQVTVMDDSVNQQPAVSLKATTNRS